MERLEFLFWEPIPYCARRSNKWLNKLKSYALRIRQFNRKSKSPLLYEVVLITDASVFKIQSRLFIDFAFGIRVQLHQDINWDKTSPHLTNPPPSPCALPLLFQGFHIFFRIPCVNSFATR